MVSLTMQDCRRARRGRQSCLCRLSMSAKRAACLLAAGTCLLQLALLARPIYADQHHGPQVAAGQSSHVSNHIQQQHVPLVAKSGQLEQAAHQQQIEHQQQLNSISQVAASGASETGLINGSPVPLALGDLASGAVSGSARSRSPRSIGEMFKKIFNGNKRSKGGAQGSRDWDQQQAANQQHQQQQQLQQNQAANMASMMAAAANQHAVYASPFATYSPQSSASAFYPQFAPYSSAGLVAWPTTASLAHSIRAAPTLIGPASPVALASSAGPLYAAASQAYNSYTAPPSAGAGSAGAAASQQLAAAAAAAAAASGQPQAAASHQHASAVPAPPGIGGPHHASGGPSSSLDFHQVLDALVRTSGFAPAGDQEAAAASGYGAKADGTPVFSFKKLVSLPFYLSTEEKSLDGLANAVGPAGSAGYSLHSMPIMRRHVRRMSTPSQQQQQFNNQLAALQTATDSSQQMQRSERAQQQSYSNYLNAINNQIASLAANNQLLQYLSARQPQQQQQQSADAYATETALANYQALLSAASAGGHKGLQPAIQTATNQVQSTSSALAGRQSPSAASPGNSMAMAASMVQPMAVQAPQSLLQQHQSAKQFEQDRDYQNLLTSIQQQFSSGSADPLGASAAFTNQIHSFSDGHRLGQSQQQQAAFYPQNTQSTQHYWPTTSFQNNNQVPADASSFLAINSNGNANNGQDYTSLAPASQLQANSAPQQQQQSSVASQNNAVGNHHHHHHHHHHQLHHNQHEQQQNNQQQQVTSGFVSAQAGASAVDAASSAPGQQTVGQQLASVSGNSQSTRDSLAGGASNNFSQQPQQIEGQQQPQQQQQQQQQK